MLYWPPYFYNTFLIGNLYLNICQEPIRKCYPLYICLKQSRVLTNWNQNLHHIEEHALRLTLTIIL